MYRWKN